VKFTHARESNDMSAIGWPCADHSPGGRISEQDMDALGDVVLPGLESLYAWWMTGNCRGKNPHRLDTDES
jgi:hypothetical protein